MSEYKLLVLSSPVPGRESEFDQWYEGHVLELVNHAAHVLGAQRFSRVDAAVGEHSPHQHLVVAEWSADDLVASWGRHLADFQAGAAVGRFTNPPGAFDPASTQHWMYEPVGPHLHKPSNRERRWPMSLAKNRAACLRFNEEAVSSGDLSVVDEVMDPDVVHRSAFPGEPPGREGVKASIEELRRGVPDLRLRADDVVAEADKVWARLRITGTHRGTLLGIPATGRRFNIEEYFAARCKDGLIVEFTSLQDRLSLMQQLGAAPLG